MVLYHNFSEKCKVPCQTLLFFLINVVYYEIRDIFGRAAEAFGKLALFLQDSSHGSSI
jgi:hypothetical protein